MHRNRLQKIMWRRAEKGGTSGVSYADTRLFRRNVHRAGRRGGFGCLGSNDKCLGIADCFGTRIPGRIGAGGLHRAELFTGNCLMMISALQKRISVGGLFKNLLFVYLGNRLARSLWRFYLSTGIFQACTAAIWRRFF